MRNRLIGVILLALACSQAPALAAEKQKKLPKPGWNMFSKDQDIQMGREYAQQIEQQFKVVDNRELTDYINRIGQRLVKQGGLEQYQYPFFFKVVHEDSINAFALPGGPMFVHTGLIKAADNEGQIAGVLAHELSHVVLRHGTNQASKAQIAQLGAVLGGAMLGNGSLTGQLAQLGIGLGANSVLLKFSRGAESDADLLGAYTMAKAGYNPIEMARFFEKLQAEAGKSNKLVEFFTSTHPNPGNRVQAIEGQLPYMPRGDYNTVEGNLKSMQAAVTKLGPAPKPKQVAQGQGQGQGQGSQPAANTPKPANVAVSSNMKVYQSSALAISYPDNWQTSAGQNSLTIAPSEGLLQGAIGYGVVVAAAQSPNGRVNLQQDTQKLLQSIAQENAGAQIVQQPQSITISGSAAMVSQLKSKSPYVNTTEIDTVITIDRGANLVYLICIAPEPDYSRFEPVFQQMVRSIQFK